MLCPMLTSLPSVAVWHQPFRVACNYIPGEQIYYDVLFSDPLWMEVSAILD